MNEIEFLKQVCVDLANTLPSSAKGAFIQQSQSVLKSLEDKLSTQEEDK